ncbi:MAG: 3-oxoacyl-ACP synthase III [Proteobacteria bacterium]|nr:3-oxoacyl-ACP synthase III [Pseudomonadota bacterium]MCP4921127.1 3-oxoacyl-ACP synthase III [Pseudomonadota bacterium]
MRYENVCVEALSHEIPDQVLTTESLESALSPLYNRLGMMPGWLETVTGIKARRMWNAADDAEKAAARAAQKALTEGGVARAQVDVLVSCSVYKQNLEPSVACKVHHALGLRPSAMNFDVGNACLGLLSGMQVVANMIELGQAKVGLVVAGECSREVTRNTLAKLRAPDAGMQDYKDNLATLTLGSAASAVLLVHKSLSVQGHKLVGGVTRSASEHAGLCYGGNKGMTTDATKLLAEGVRLARSTWDEFRREQGEARAYALHQVGKANHDTVCSTLGIDQRSALRIYPEIGNVGAASVAIAAAKTVEAGHVGVGDTLALMGIGSGLNVSMMRIDW